MASGRWSSAAVIDRVLQALRSHPAALPALPVIDTLKRGEHGAVVGTVDRTGLYRAQTPAGLSLCARSWQRIGASRARP